MQDLTSGLKLRATGKEPFPLREGTVAKRFVEMFEDPAGVLMAEARAAMKFDDGTPCFINNVTVHMLIKDGFLEVVT